MTTKVTGDQYLRLDAKLFEIKRQIRQRSGYPFDVNALEKFLQLAIEGKFPQSLHPKMWHEKDGVIYLTVTSDGKTGLEWLLHFKSKGIRVGRCIQSVILSKEFKPVKGMVYKVAVMRGEFLCADPNHIRPRIKEEAHNRKMIVPNPEVACLIRDMFTDEQIKETGLFWIVVMHEPIKDCDGGMCQIGVHTNSSRLGSFYGSKNNGCHRGDGFAYIMP